MTDSKIDDIERQLSEKRLEARNTKAQVTDVSVPDDDPPGIPDDRDAVAVTFETVAGAEVYVPLPVPEEYDPQQSDLVTLLEFTRANVNDLDSLEGQRVPFSEGNVRFDVMRQVIESAAAAADDWDQVKFQRKAQAFIDGGL